MTFEMAELSSSWPDFPGTVRTHQATTGCHGSSGRCAAQPHLNVDPTPYAAEDAADSSSGSSQDPTLLTFSSWGPFSLRK
jgi:hypothetical protein